jgi:hypothetical protein
MKKSATLLVTLLTAGSAIAADPGTSTKVEDAIARLQAASNYSWTTIMKIPDMPFEPGPLKGRAERTGRAIVTQQFNENTFEAAFKGEKIAVSSQGQWESIEQADEQTAMMGSWLTNSGAAAEEAAKLLKCVKDLKAVDDALVGDLTPDGAREILTLHPRTGNAPPAPKNTTGSVKFWLKDGSLVKFEAHFQGISAFNPDQEERSFEITRTVEIRDVGTTKLDLPDDAAKILEAK